MARILVLEDTPDAAQLMHHVLRASGHEPVLAGDLAEARRSLRGERIDLCLFDVQLPDGTGYDLLAEARADPSLTTGPIIAVTAFAMLSDRNQALAAGFDGYLAKPFSPRQLVKAVNAYLPLALRGHDLPATASQAGRPRTTPETVPAASASRTVGAVTTGRGGADTPRSKRAITIGVVTPFVGRWYFSEVFGGIEQALRGQDANIVLHSTHADATPSPHTQPAAERLRGRVDGVLLVALPVTNRAVADLPGLGVPLVLLGTTGADLPSVSIDDHDGALAAVNHLIEQGHRRVALIGGDPSETAFVPEQARVRGYLDALTRHDLPAPPSLRRDGRFTARGGYTAMTELLAAEPGLTAVFCLSDEMAFGALKAVADAGRRPGRDIAIIGFDGHELSEMFDLSTISQPARDLGRVATTTLLARTIDTTPATDLRLPTTLTARGSTKTSD